MALICGSIDNTHSVCSKFEILENPRERELGEAVARGKTLSSHVSPNANSYNNCLL